MLNAFCYMRDNWDSVAGEGANIVVAAGVHGVDDGRIGHADSSLFRQMTKASEKLGVMKGDQIKADNVSLTPIDVGGFYQNERWDWKGLIEAMRSLSPTVVLLAVCWSRQSLLDARIRAGGIYAEAVLRNLGQDQLISTVRIIADNMDSRHVVLTGLRRGCVVARTLLLLRSPRSCSVGA